MPVGEWVAGVLGAGLVGGLASATVVLLLAHVGRRATELAARRVDAYGRWLAARLALSRESATFVVAFRTLAAEPRKSKAFGFRMEEAQRARTHWHEAVAGLERAEAELLAWTPRSGIAADLHAIPRPTLQDLRRAVRGEEQDVDELLGRLLDNDRKAIDVVSGRTRDLLEGPPRWRRAVSAAVWHVRDVFDDRRGSR